MSHAVDVVDNRTGEVVRRVGFVVVARSGQNESLLQIGDVPGDMMRCLDISEHYRISHRSIFMLIVYLGSTTPFSSLLRPLEEVLESGEILLNTGFSILGGDLGSSLLLDLRQLSLLLTLGSGTDRLSVCVVHVHIALLDELLRIGLDPVEMIRCMYDLVIRYLDHLQILLDRRLKLALSPSVQTQKARSPPLSTGWCRQIGG